MPTLSQCKKLIEQDANKDYKPTISHYRDKENGMLKKQNTTNSTLPYKVVITAPNKKQHTVYCKTIPEAMKIANQSINIIGGKATVRNNEVGGYAHYSVIGKSKNPSQTTKRASNPTTKTTIKRSSKTVVKSNPNIYGEMIRDAKLKLAKLETQLRNTHRSETGKRESLQTSIRALKNSIAFYQNSATKTRANCPIKSKTRANFTRADFKQHQKIQLDELAKMFQGHANGLSLRVIEPDLAPSQKFRLGFLALMKVKHNGVIIPLHFDNESLLSADLKKGLWVSGKDSVIDSASLRSLGIKKPHKNGLEIIGDLQQINYITAKSHIENGETVQFYHKLGEANGRRPKLAVDHDGFPIILGGEYDIWDVGIVN